MSVRRARRLLGAPPVSRALSILLLVVSCGRGAPPPMPVPDEPYARLEHEYVVFILDRYPVVATYLGGSAFDARLAGVDGRLRDLSPAAIAEEDAKLADFRDRLRAVPEAALSPRRTIDREVALAQIGFLLHQHGVLRHAEVAIDSMVDEPFRGVDWQLQGMSGEPEEWHDVLSRTRAVPSYLGRARDQLAAGVAAGHTPDWRVLVEHGQASTLANAEYFEKTLPALAKERGADPALVAELRTAGAEAAAAYRRLHDFVLATYFDAPDRPKAAYRADRYALGEVEYDRALRENLRVDETAASLYGKSWPIVEATQAAMVERARAVAATHGLAVPAGDTDLVRLVLALLGESAPATDDEMMAGYRSAGIRLVAYARRTGLFEVPLDYRLDVTVTPPPLRSSIDSAAYYAAPPFKTSGVGRFYVTPTGNDRALLRQEHNDAARADLAAHEGFPGHDWHYKVMTQAHGEISPVRWLTVGAVEDSSSMWQDSMATEGWALYAETLLGEPEIGAPAGFYTPEESLYALRGKLTRDLRVRIDTGIHTGRLGFEDAVSLFSQVVDLLPGPCTGTLSDAKRASCASARAEVTRYSRWPTQAVTYRLGMDAIVALRERARAKLGARFSSQRFHLELMRQGTIPPGYFGDELLRALDR